MCIISCILLKCMINWWSWKARLRHVSSLSVSLIISLFSLFISLTYLSPPSLSSLSISLLLSYFKSFSWVCLFFFRCYTSLCSTLSSLSFSDPILTSVSSPPSIALSLSPFSSSLSLSFLPYIHFSLTPPPPPPHTHTFCPFIHFSLPSSFSLHL